MSNPNNYQLTRYILTEKALMTPERIFDKMNEAWNGGLGYSLENIYDFALDEYTGYWKVRLMTNNIIYTELYVK